MKINDDDLKLLDVHKNNPREFYKKIIDGLLDVHHEDRLTVLTLLTMVIHYMNGSTFTSEELKRHKLVVSTVMNDYGLNSFTDIVVMTEECAEKMNSSRLANMPEVGGVQ